jgi:CubicO group peptidase (beta-lactamase class C family)
MAEAASGVAFETLMEERLLRPLGMAQTGFSLAADAGTLDPRAKARGEGRYVSCGGGMSSTLDDLATFYEMLLQGGVYEGQRILSAGSVQDMTRKHAVNPRKRDDPYTTGEYGLALYRDRVGADGVPLTISHGGALGSMPWADLDRDLVGVFLSEGRLARVMPLIARVQEAVRDLIPAGTGNWEPRGTAPDWPSAPSDRHGHRNADDSEAPRDPRAVFQLMSGGRLSVSSEDFQDFFASRPIAERLSGRQEVADRIFRRLDVNGDGQLTVEEYERIRDLRVEGLRR